MRIVHSDRKRGSLKLAIDCMEDLWYLHQFLVPGDRVYASTHRREEKKTDKLRAEKRDKKRMYLGIGVEKVEYHSYSDNLRVTGPIVEGPQDLGSYHTLNVAPGTVLTVVKEMWTKLHRRIINKARESAGKPNVIVASVDDDSITVAKVFSYGIKEHATVHLSDHGKGPDSKGQSGRKEMYGEGLRVLKRAHGGNEPLLVVGPGFIKDDFLDFIREGGEEELLEKYAVDNTGSGGMRGVYESLKRGAMDTILENAVAQAEMKTVEVLFSSISKGDGLNEYGEERVMKALNAGAVQALMMTSEFVQKLSGDMKTMTRIDELCEQIRAEVKIISSEHEAGERLDSLGGIAALLRYRIQ